MNEHPILLYLKAAVPVAAKNQGVPLIDRGPLPGPLLQLESIGSRERRRLGTTSCKVLPPLGPCMGLQYEGDIIFPCSMAHKLRLCQCGQEVFKGSMNSPLTSKEMHPVPFIS